MAIDLSTLQQPGVSASGPMPAPNAPAPPPEAMTPAAAQPSMTPAPETGVNPQQPPAPPKGGTPVGTPNPPPHARLLAMVQGLSIGLGAAAKSIATHGAEGGAAEVIAERGAQQRQQEEAQAAATAQKNAKLQQTMWQGEINHTNLQNISLAGSLPREAELGHFQVQQAKIATQKEAQEVYNTTAAVPEGWVVDEQTGQLREAPAGAPAAGATPAAATQSPAGTPNVIPGVTPAAPAAAAPNTATPAVPAGTPNVLPGVTPNAPAAGTPAAPAAAAPTVNSPYNQRLNMTLDTIGKTLQSPTGQDDPLVANARAIIANPASTPSQKQHAVLQVQLKAGLNNQAIKDMTEKADLAAKQQATLAASPVEKLSTPEALAAPGAQAAIQAKIDDPTTAPADIPRLRALLPQAAVAQHQVLVQKQREDQASQLVAQGDPDMAGKLLADRTLTIDELKLRNATPQFMENAVNAAKRYDPTFRAPEAAAQAQIARSAANQQFFGNTDSLLVKGGTLDQLASAGLALGNQQLPVLNTLENWSKAALGQGPQAAFAAAALGVADDYSKVMSGGQGSDTSRLQALNIIKANLSPEQRLAAINQIKKSVQSQRNGRVGTNPYMKDMYPDPATMQETPGVAGTAPVKPTVINPVTKQSQTIGHAVGDIITQNGHNYTVTSVDSTGKVTGAH